MTAESPVDIADMRHDAAKTAHAVHHVDTSAPPEAIWACWEDVAGWPSWNSGIEKIVLHGEFRDGETFEMTPPGPQKLVSRLLAVQRPLGFADETMVGDARVMVDRHCEQIALGVTRITYATTVSGPDAAAICAAVSEDFPEVLAALAHGAEAWAER